MEASRKPYRINRSPAEIIDYRKIDSFNCSVLKWPDSPQVEPLFLPPKNHGLEVIVRLRLSPTAEDVFSFVQNHGDVLFFIQGRAGQANSVPGIRSVDQLGLTKRYPSN